MPASAPSQCEQRAASGQQADMSKGTVGRLSVGAAEMPAACAAEGLHGADASPAGCKAVVLQRDSEEGQARCAAPASHAQPDVRLPQGQHHGGGSERGGSEPPGRSRRASDTAGGQAQPCAHSAADSRDAGSLTRAELAQDGQPRAVDMDSAQAPEARGGDGAAECAPPSRGGGLELSQVDVEEQKRILRDIWLRKGDGTNPKPPAQQKGGPGKRGREAGPAAKTGSGKQLRISAMLGVPRS